MSQLSAQSRAPAEVSLDGRFVHLLYPTEYLSVSMSRYPLPCVVPSTRVTSGDVPPLLLQQGPQSADMGDIGAEEGKLEQTDEVLDGGWVNDINAMLSFNKAFVTKGVMKHMDE